MSGIGSLWVLCGGSGTRLWPLSREEYPKQFLEIGNLRRPLLIQTLDRLKPLGALNILTTKTLGSPTLGSLKSFSLEASVHFEPAIRNTAAAVLHACSLSYHQDPSAVVGIFPADHFIRDGAKFREAVERAFTVARAGTVVTMGIRPTYPATAYGYMELEASENEICSVKRFVEKPQIGIARELISKSNVVWNAGIFVFPAKLIREHYRKLLPELWAIYMEYEEGGKPLEEVYKRLPSLSIDTGIMEKLKDLRCIPIDIGWSDVGCWEEAIGVGGSQGTAVELDSAENRYHNPGRPEKLAAFVGVKDLIVVDTADALLVMQKGCGQKVKDIVDIVKRDRPELAKSHMFESRPWGTFEVLLDTPHFKSKVITVLPGQKLSYQSHQKREENWIITQGQAEVVLNEVRHTLKVGDHIRIPLGAKHRIGNIGNQILEFIEVQHGSYFGEDDIVRYQDDYQRI